MTSVAATEFKHRTGRYIDDAAKAPVFITKHNRAVRVLIDIDEYDRLKACDTRRAVFTRDLSPEWKAAIAKADVGHLDPALDELMD